MPVDAEVSVKGSLLLQDGEAGTVDARVVPAIDRIGRTDLHRSHFATCPHGRAWRRRQRR
jgi:hypothetical protein